MKNNIYDLIIIGAGPAGMSAGIYAGRFRIKTLIIAKDIGGTCNVAHLIENYPGFKSIQGMDLMTKFKEHLDDYQDKVEIKNEEVRGVEKRKGNFILFTDEEKYQTKSIILASGTERRKLNIPGENEFLGKGVSYCATCDATFFRNKVVGVVGGSNAAVTAAILLSEYAKKVYLIHRNSSFDKAEPLWVERLKNNSKITVIFKTSVEKINGDKVVKSIKLSNLYQGKKILNLDGVFVEIGSCPTLSIAKKLKVKVDQDNLIVVDQNCETNISGVYAAGDITSGFSNLKQVITAAAGGAVAASSVYGWLIKNKNKS